MRARSGMPEPATRYTLRPMSVYDLNGKVALVTGAARGIGFETARQMHLRGASVAVLDLDAAEAREAAERIGPRAIGIGADVTDQGAMMAAVAEVVDKFGGLDCVVANAGIAQKQMSTVYSMSGEEWERVVEVDLLGVFRTVRRTPRRSTSSTRSHSSPDIP